MNSQENSGDGQNVKDRDRHRDLDRALPIPSPIAFVASERKRVSQTKTPKKIGTSPTNFSISLTESIPEDLGIDFSSDISINSIPFPFGENYFNVNVLGDEIEQDYDIGERGFYSYSSPNTPLKNTPSEERQQQMELATQELNKNYTSITQIANTKTSIIYKAINRKTNSTCVIKNILSSYLKTQQSQKIAQREYKTAKKLDHPNILKYLGAIFCGPFIYFELEYCSLGSLDNYIRKKPLKKNGCETEEFWFLGMDILMGLAYIHKSNYVHLDIKPANIFLVRGFDPEIPTAKIGDFGLASKIGSPRKKKYKKGDGFYLAPELLDKKRPVSDKADIYSLGISFLEMGSDFVASSALWAEILSKDGNIEAETYGFSSHLAQLLCSTLCKDPAFRSNATELLLFPQFQNITGRVIQMEDFDKIPNNNTESSSEENEIFQERIPEKEEENNIFATSVRKNAPSSEKKPLKKPQQNFDFVKKKLQF